MGIAIWVSGGRDILDGIGGGPLRLDGGPAGGGPLSPEGREGIVGGVGSR